MDQLPTILIGVIIEYLDEESRYEIRERYKEII